MHKHNQHLKATTLFWTTMDVKNVMMACSLVIKRLFASYAYHGLWRETWIKELWLIIETLPLMAHGTVRCENKLLSAFKSVQMKDKGSRRAKDQWIYYIEYCGRVSKLNAFPHYYSRTISQYICTNRLRLGKEKKEGQCIRDHMSTLSFAILAGRAPFHTMDDTVYLLPPDTHLWPIRHSLARISLTNFPVLVIFALQATILCLTIWSSLKYTTEYFSSSWEKQRTIKNVVIKFQNTAKLNKYIFLLVQPLPKTTKTAICLSPR